ncbi:MAG: hypothetical protein ISS16_09235 [Ignavibacteria bacterium]|nr:hypothetical protein [Ignavibacteria bacterium]
MKQITIYIFLFLFVSAYGQNDHNTSSASETLNKNQTIINDVESIDIILKNNKKLVKTFVLKKTEKGSLENYVDLFIMLERTQRYLNLNTSSKKLYQQYIGFINNNGEKVCYAICFSKKVKNEYLKDWKKKAYLISDYMDDDYFSFIINFDKRCIENRNCCE